ncbi:hypothetical protein N7478_009372 [Penicillium angulare]|uniref:uncharacterized protein n=1 Tax=Penicillium angulare TaxID=116970 RepID=UPI00253F66BA|nr:uncharacterized protein N7478_009372 [Penicillium angulare]KAJ5266564.1 hypothetical protein N7478_009372 [Penicillium angulare]
MNDDVFGGYGSPQQLDNLSLHPQPSDRPSSPPSQSDYGEFPSFNSLDDEPKTKSSDAPTENLPTSSNIGTVSETYDENGTYPIQSNRPSAQMLPPPKPSIAPNPQMTSEEYNAQLLSDPRMRNSSVVNPDFIQQYYRESRLHHLSTWKADLKAQLQAATKDKVQSQVAKKKPVPGARRYVLHVDFDSFFAAVALLKHPELKDKPVAIAHGPGAGSEIASCNYVARASGIKNGMWMKGALDACPQLQVLPYDFPAYEEASRKFYNSVLAIDGIIQSVSIDEALIDVTQLCLEAGGSDGRGVSEGSIYREQAKADEIGQDLRDSVKEKTGCAVSVGIGANILQAKVALRKAKPAGQFQMKPDDVLQFMGDLTVRDLPGVGHSLSAKLEEIGATLVKDMRDFSRERLVSALGPKTGIRMWEYARGVDKTEVGIEVIRKSVSAEVNWGIRFVNQDQAEDFVSSLCGELNRRLVENLVKGKQLTLKVMRRSMDAPLEPVKHLGHGKCDTFNKSIVIGVATNVTDIIAKEAIVMLRSFNFSPGDLRGLGVQMTKLEPLKAGQSSNVDSSQRQLNFAKSPSRMRTADMIETDSPSKVEMPRIDHRTPTNISRSPADIPGSQFIMPTQVDPAVLSELPSEIRSRLVAQSKSEDEPRVTSPSPAPRPVAPAPALPPQSQLDPEILLALPDDVRDEVLGYYDQQTPPLEPPAPVAAVPGPRAVPVSRPLSSGNVGVKRPYSPPKKRRGRPPKFSRVDHRTQTLSNFVSRPAPTFPPIGQSAPRQPSPTHEPESEISSEFLAALPEDIRQEILEEQRRTRMLQQSHANTPTVNPGPDTEPNPLAVIAAPDERRLPLPPLPERPVFTSQRLSALPDLRAAVREWHSAFLDHGPYGEDVEVMSTYLGRVIVDEKDIEKAVAVVRWLIWLIDEDNVGRVPIDNQTPRSEQGIVTWAEAIEMLHACVQTALEVRGMAPVDFD